MSKYSEKFKKLVEDDLVKMLGKPVINMKLWLWMVLKAKLNINIFGL